jgi:hypothetical protein
MTASSQVTTEADFQTALREIELLFDPASAPPELTAPESAELDAVGADRSVAQIAKLPIDTNVQSEPTEA